MPDATTTELARALLRGDAALWLGPQWHPPTDPADGRLLGTLPWLGIWSDSRDPVLLQLLMTFKGPSPRLLIDVPDRMDAVLGDHYSFANVCPYFYLRGPQGTATRPRSIQHRRARDAKVEQLARLGPSVLIVTGYDEAGDLAEALGEIDEVAPDLRLIVAVGIDLGKIAQLQEAAYAGLAQRLRLSAATLCSLVRDIERLRAELPQEPTLLLGRTKVPLASFVRREAPVDEEFLLLTEQDTQLPRPDENARDLIAHLISGRGRPWRALAHGLAWKRPLPHLQRSREAIDRVRHGKAEVVCLDIPAESGSGLTTLLETIAFEAASAGSPALFYRGSASLNYGSLRAFLTDLYQYEGLSAADQASPSLLVFDAQAVAADAMGLLSELPSRLSRDGRRVVIIRGVPILQSEDEAALRQRIRPALKSGRGVESAVLPRLAADLEPNQQADLVRWVTEVHTRIGAPVPPGSVETIQRWNLGVARIPLLVCLYFILQGHYQEVSRLGSHLVNQAKEGLVLSRTGSAAPEAGNRRLTGAELLRAVRSLQDGLASGRFVESPPSAEQVGDVLMVLSVFGSLMVRIPRHVLADVAGVAPDRILRVLLHLERKELIETSHAPIARANEDRLAPIAYYSTHESVALFRDCFCICLQTPDFRPRWRIHCFSFSVQV